MNYKIYIVYNTKTLRIMAAYSDPDKRGYEWEDSDNQETYLTEAEFESFENDVLEFDYAEIPLRLTHTDAGEFVAYTSRIPELFE